MFDLNQQGWFERVADYGMVSGASNHASRMETIRDTWEKYGVMIDTHTADGLKVGLEYFEPGVPMIVLETALPAKFDEAIHEALGRAPERPDSIGDIENLPQRFTVMRNNVEDVKQFIVSHLTN
jgi:threonine synthase